MTLELVSSEDKIAITELLKKPWNPYIRRHSALTDKSKFLKESILKSHAGWIVFQICPKSIYIILVMNLREYLRSIWP